MKLTETERLKVILTISEKSSKLILELLRKQIIYLDTSWNYIKERYPEIYKEANVEEFRMRSAYLLNEVLKIYETN